jgi:5-methyltetrahydropteroyltriglutamate--homocysteine methyltransferase
VQRQLPGKTILVGVIDLADGSVEPAQTVAARIRCALEHVPAERVVVAPDCGMKYLPRDVAAGKLRALVDGARLVRKELGAG